MKNTQELLTNPIVLQALTLAAPSIAASLSVVMKLVAKNSEDDFFLKAIDVRLNLMLTILASNESVPLKRESEIRAHELLGLLNRYEISQR